MQISVLGCGYLGIAQAAVLAGAGHDVVAFDVDEVRVATLNAGETPLFEPGLPEALSSATAAGKLRFTTIISEVAAAQLHFICVGTPQAAETPRADLSQVHSALSLLLGQLGAGDVVVGRSTVPVGTVATLAPLVEGTGSTLLWSPEFLREGYAIVDLSQPDRVVVGAPATPAGSRAVEVLRSVSADSSTSQAPWIVTDYATAELVKGAANAFLATKLSFINAIAEVAEAAGADVSTLAEALGHDPRIGPRYLRAGIGFGGGCLPKDIRAFGARAEELGARASVQLLQAVDDINLSRRGRALALVREAVGGELAGSRVTVLGASFKPDSDDIRDSPALAVALALSEDGAIVTITDPVALSSVRATAPGLHCVEGLDEALTGADAVLLATEWDAYTTGLDPAHARTLVRRPAIIDGRNCLNSQSWREAGWTYIGMGAQ